MMKRRTFIKQNLITVPLIVSGVNPFLESSKTFSPEQNLIKDGYKQIFNGKTLKGWHSAPRLPMPRFVGGTPPDKDNENYKKALTSKGLWTVQDGAIIGGQDPPGSGMGGYLVSDDEYGDFDLVLDARPDWPVDTGILIRAGSAGVPGIQVLLDHRKSGGIGGFYGNGLGGYHALAYNFDAKLDENGRPVGLMAEKPETTNEPVTDAKRNLL